jgi:hypothetical protein
VEVASKFRRNHCDAGDRTWGDAFTDGRSSFGEGYEAFDGLSWQGGNKFWWSHGYRNEQSALNLLNFDLAMIMEFGLFESRLEAFGDLLESSSLISCG